jgi:hypothetical protein
MSPVSDVQRCEPIFANEQVTPTKRKGDMGPPTTPASSSSSRALVIRATTPSSRERNQSVTSDRGRVKTEPIEFGTPVSL